jgi:hypothetical protein
MKLNNLLVDDFEECEMCPPLVVDIESITVTAYQCDQWIAISTVTGKLETVGSGVSVDIVC